ncbi:LysR family transcriptional regulator [Exiguobacterium antarcticum]|uniref:LysR family transcriptional regulator n=1 Tax=Exiguobacterium antarcticum TaxID=132920 RepID=A0ABT6R3N4_9BACL|nr:LysR family transcriptional regulator [Exiguobacterium antarcticum]AFS69483.1 Transcriptional regulator, LysR family [Exiguobacterium antarcticum B7]MDI3235438.1 LysR family transcriptional regulator [Exiguobacterium antarcticum]
MNFNELKTFVMLVETKHFTKTAEQLYISQPTVSLHLKHLEEHFGQSLIHRHTFNKTIEISEAGWIVYRHAKEILHQTTRLEQEMDDLEGITRGTLRIAATHTIYEAMLEQMIHDFLLAYPDVSVDARVMNQEQVEHALRHYEIDLGMVEGPHHSHQIDAIPFATDRLRIIGHESLVPEQATWIYREEGSAARLALETWLATQAIVPKRIITVYSNRLIKQLITNGTGISILSERLAGTLLESERFKTHDDSRIDQRMFQFITLKGETTRLSQKWMNEHSISN